MATHGSCLLVALFFSDAVRLPPLPAPACPLLPDLGFLTGRRRPHLRTRPAELGFLFHSRQWEPPSALISVEAYVYLQSTKRIVGNIGTYESAVLGVANASQLQELRRSRPR